MIGRAASMSATGRKMSVLATTMLLLSGTAAAGDDDFLCAARATVLQALSHPRKDNVYVTSRVNEPIADGWCAPARIGLVLVRAFPSKGMAHFRVSCAGTPKFIARWLNTHPATPIAIDPLSDYEGVKALPEPVCRPSKE